MQVKVLKALILVALLVSLALYFQAEVNVYLSSFSQFIFELSISSIFVLSGLSFLNWFLEGRKWKLLLREKINEKKLDLGFVRGLSLIMFSPSRQGQLVGRLSTISRKLWKSAFYAYLVSASMQVVITMLFGALFLLIKPIPSYSWIGIVAIGFCLVYVFLLLKFWRFLAKVSTVKNLIKIALLSTVRYLIFIASYVFVLGNGDYSLLEVCSVISLFFVLNTLTPIGVLGELGKRELTLAALFILFFGEVGASVNTSLCIWGFNVLLPALIGCFAWLIPSPK